MTTLRAELTEWIRRARDGKKVVVIKRGRPVNRLSPFSTTTLVDELVAEGVVEPLRRTPERVVHRA